MSLSITLSPTWAVWPLATWNWFYTHWIYCERCSDGHYLRRSLNLHIALPFADLHIGTPAWFRTYYAKQGHAVRAEEPPQ